MRLQIRDMIFALVPEKGDQKIIIASPCTDRCLVPPDDADDEMREDFAAVKRKLDELIAELQSRERLTERLSLINATEVRTAEEQLDTVRDAIEARKRELGI